MQTEITTIKLQKRVQLLYVLLITLSPKGEAFINGLSLTSDLAM